MREIRTSGSEGGVALKDAIPTPIVTPTRRRHPWTPVFTGVTIFARASVVKLFESLKRLFSVITAKAVPGWDLDGFRSNDGLLTTVLVFADSGHILPEVLERAKMLQKFLIKLLTLPKRGIMLELEAQSAAEFFRSARLFTACHLGKRGSELPGMLLNEIIVSVYRYSFTVVREKPKKCLFRSTVNGYAAAQHQD